MLDSSAMRAEALRLRVEGERDCPQEGVGIEQNFHSPSPFQRRSSASGRGSKKASVRVKPGVSRAPRRFLPMGWIASSLATGVFSRPEVMMMISPFCAF